MTAGCASDGSEMSFSSCKTMSCQSANALQKGIAQAEKNRLDSGQSQKCMHAPEGFGED